jgi:CelD/BcsL family acetyltransferase involved in cellulose biosynthesis
MLAGPYEPVRGFVCHAHATEEVSRAFARTLVTMQRWRDVVRLGPIDVSWPEIEALFRALSLETDRVFTLATEANICAREIATTESDFHSQVRRNSDLKRSISRQRKLEQEGNFRLVRYRNPLGEELKRVLRDCGTVESRSWLARDPEGRMRFNGKRQFRFWERVCSEHLSRHDQLDIWVAYLDEKPIAFDFVVTTNTIRYLIAGQYDESHRKLGLGWMLYGSYAREGIERGVRIVEMGTGEPAYKARMGGQPENVRRSVSLMPPGPAGYLAARLLNNERVRRFMLSSSSRKLMRRVLGGVFSGPRAGS